MRASDKTAGHPVPLTSTVRPTQAEGSVAIECQTANSADLCHTIPLSRLHRSVAAGLLVLILLVGSSCGNSDKDTSKDTTTSTAMPGRRAVVPLSPPVLPPIDIDRDDAGKIKTVTLSADALFDLNSPELREDQEPSLAPLVEDLPSLIDRYLFVEGYTDGLGDTEHNDALSWDRANAIIEALVAAPIENDGKVTTFPRERITPCGRGEKGAPDGVPRPDLRRVVITVHDKPMKCDA